MAIIQRTLEVHETDATGGSIATALNLVEERITRHDDMLCTLAQRDIDQRSDVDGNL